MLLGEQTVEGYGDYISAGFAQSFHYTATTSGTTTDVEVYVDSSNAATGLTVGLYSDSAGEPKTRLAVGSRSGLTAGAWNDVKIGSANVTAGTGYDIAFLPSGGRFRFRDAGAGVTSYGFETSSLPATWTNYALHWAFGPASAYVDGTASTPLPTSGVGPSNTVAPVISGTPQQGDTLTVSDGTWSGETPMTFTCSWSDGHTGCSDTLSAADVGASVTATVTATNGAGSANATSASVGPITGTSPPPTGYDQTVLADSPVAFWDMSSTGSTEPDVTGNGNTGTYEGGHPASAKMPNGDTAQDFSGANYLTVPSNATFSIPTTKQLTWEAWIRPDTLQWPNDYLNFLGKCANFSPTCEWEGRMYASSNSQGRCNRLSAYVYAPTAYYGSGSDWQPECNLLQAGQWLQVVGEYQTITTPSGCSSAYPGSITIWVNGIQTPWDGPTGCMSQYNAAPGALGSPLNIGLVQPGRQGLPGAIGKVAIYDHLLTQAQIDAQFTAMTGAQPSGNCNGPKIGQTPSCTVPVPTP